MSQLGVGVTYYRIFTPVATWAVHQSLASGINGMILPPYHKKLTEAVEEVLFGNNHCLIVDGRSVPALPIPYELNKSTFRPDFCLGRNNFHTPWELVAKIESKLENSVAMRLSRISFSLEPLPQWSTIIKIDVYNHRSLSKSLALLGRGLFAWFRDVGNVGRVIEACWRGIKKPLI